MSLSDLIAAEAKRPGSKCSFEYIFSQLTEQEAAELRENLAADPRIITHAMIHRALTKPKSDGGHYAFTMGRDTVRRHRAHECSCVVV